MVVYCLSYLAKLELLLKQIHVRSEQDEDGAFSGGEVLLQAQRSPPFTTRGLFKTCSNVPKDVM